MFIAPNSKSSTPPLEINGNIITDERDKSNVLNNFFQSQTLLNDQDAILPDLPPSTFQTHLQNIVLTPTEVELVLETLSIGKASGPNGLNNRIIRALSYELSYPFCSLFNQSLQTGVVPTSYKEANVCPVPKTGDLSMVSNYRPISLLNAEDKVFERLIFKYLFNHLQDNNLLSSLQSGFIPGDSTINQLTFLYNTFYQALDAGKEVRAVFCDISKAFDRVWHSGLLHKLQAAEVCGPYCNVETNERGLRLLEFATFNNLVLTNTLGPHKPSRRWTWHSPDGKHHNQIDYILVKKRFRSGVNIHRTRSFPGADIGSDHDLVMMTFQVRLKKTRKPNQPRLRFDLEKLRDPDVACTFQATIGGKFAPLIGLSDEDMDMDTMITTYNTAVTDAASEILGKERRRKKPWVTKDVLDLCDERRDLKKKRYEAEGAKEYREANRRIQKAVKKAKEDWIGAQCEEIETCLNKNNSKRAYQLVKDLTSEKQGRSSTIQDKSGKCLTEEKEILSRWTEYCSELYNYESCGDNTVLDCSQPPEEDLQPILREEVEIAVASLKKGFRAGRSTTEQIFNLRILCEKYLQHQQTLYHVFIDFKKAFDRVWHAALWATMRKYNISANLGRTIEQLYDKATSAVQMNGSIGEWFRTTVGVRQGCLLSPTLFNIFLERIMSDALEEHDGKVSIGGRNITSLRFADDIDALAEEEQELEALVESLDKTCTRYKMEISAEKTKLMTNSANGIQREIKVKGQKLGTVTSFKYLGAVVSDDGSKPEVRSRIAQATAALTKLKPIWRDNNISLGSKVKLMRSLVSSIFLYACESWTLTAELEKRTQAFEMRCYRRLLNISYKDHVTNEEVRRKIQAAIGEYDELLTLVKKRKLRWFGHVSRSSGLAKTILQGTVKGKRKRGRQKKRWEDNIKEWTGMDFASSTRAAENRSRWKGVVANSSVVPRRPSRVMG